MRNKGFTLVELSIVLVIIGLLIGGIIAGSDLINVAAHRRVISEIQRYDTAVNLFRTTYSSLPGDMPNAKQTFGDDCLATVCDGDGDHLIEYADASPYEGDKEEGPLAWLHLSLAKLIEDGGFTGEFDNTTTNTGVPGTIYPLSQFNNGAYSFSSYRTGESTPGTVTKRGGVSYDNSSGLFKVNYTYKNITDGTTTISNALKGSYLVLGKASNQQPRFAVLNTLEVYKIDQKMDDGAEESGTFSGNMSGRIIPVSATATTSTLDEETNVEVCTYVAANFQNESPTCILLFRINEE
jgi:prepilin-type N-terminal cleavage/methylation domain-containing protein